MTNPCVCAAAVRSAGEPHLQHLRGHRLALRRESVPRYEICRTPAGRPEVARTRRGGSQWNGTVGYAGELMGLAILVQDRLRYADTVHFGSLARYV
jgi:hypothetical protein